MMCNCNLTAYGLYSPELCEDFILDFYEDNTKKFLERQQELLEELERIGSFQIPSTIYMQECGAGAGFRNGQGVSPSFRR